MHAAPTYRREGLRWQGVGAEPDWSKAMFWYPSTASLLPYRTGPSRCNGWLPFLAAPRPTDRAFLCQRPRGPSSTCPRPSPENTPLLPVSTRSLQCCSMPRGTGRWRAAAEQAHRAAQFRVGAALYDGAGALPPLAPRPHPDLAARWWMEASKPSTKADGLQYTAGHPDAQYCLARYRAHPASRSLMRPWP